LAVRDRSTRRAGGSETKRPFRFAFAFAVHWRLDMTATNTPIILIDPPVPDAATPGGSGTVQGVNWQPDWVVDAGTDCEVGLTTDDGCFLVLYPQPDDSWRPGKHIPRQVAERIGQLVASGALD
jgi:hypothetical protein